MATINKQEIIAKYGRTPEKPQERSPLQTWSAENGWSEKRSAELPERTGYRKISYNHCRTGSEKVRHKPKDQEKRGHFSSLFFYQTKTKKVAL